MKDKSIVCCILFLNIINVVFDICLNYSHSSPHQCLLNKYYIGPYNFLVFSSLTLSILAVFMSRPHLTKIYRFFWIIQRFLIKANNNKIPTIVTIKFCSLLNSRYSLISYICSLLERRYLSTNITSHFEIYITPRLLEFFFWFTSIFRDKDDIHWVSDSLKIRDSF